MGEVTGGRTRRCVAEGMYHRSWIQASHGDFIGGEVELDLGWRRHAKGSEVAEPSFDRRDACFAVVALTIQQGLPVVVGYVLLMTFHSSGELIEGFAVGCLDKQRFIDGTLTRRAGDQPGVTLRYLPGLERFTRGGQFCQPGRCFDVAFGVTTRSPEFVAD